MLYELVTKILEKGKAEGVDLIVARDMLVNETPDEYDNLYDAGEVIRYYYDEITLLRRKGNEDAIKEICGLYKDGDHVAIKALIEELGI